MDLKPLSAAALLACCALVLGACTESSPTPAPATRAQASDLIVVTDPELRCIVNDIAEHVLRVEYVGPGVRAGHTASWTPDSEQAELLRTARIVFAGPTGSQAWLDTLGVRTDRVVRIGDGTPGTLIPVGASTHSHGPGGEHSHDVYAPAPWYDPDVAPDLVREALAAIVRAWPTNAEPASAAAGLLIDRIEAVARDYPSDATDVLLASDDDAHRYIARAMGATFLPIDASTNPATIRRACTRTGATRLVVLGNALPEGLEETFDSDESIVTIARRAETDPPIGEDPCDWLYAVSGAASMVRDGRLAP